MTYFILRSTIISYLLTIPKYDVHISCGLKDKSLNCEIKVKVTYIILRSTIISYLLTMFIPVVSMIKGKLTEL